MEVVDREGGGDALIEDDEEGGIRIDDVYIPPPPLPACTFDSTGPRLIITHIENINFKSYAGHKILGPLHKNFTSIVGPNGSGKSNVIDAMLFVFGYRAQKIRSKKVGVLIHHSDMFPNLQSCTVKVHFQMVKDKGAHEYEGIPDSEFYIARTAYKDNTSTYQINGDRAQFKKVTGLLRSYGIDLDHNRFLILQGEIEMIALMKPKGSENDTGMLEYLEDIIGCNRFIEPIQKFSARVDECNDARTEKLNRVKAVEKDKDDMESAKNEAVGFLKLENKQTFLENQILQSHLRGAQTDLEIATEVKDKTKASLNDLSAAQDKLKEERIVKEQEHDRVKVSYEKAFNAMEGCKEEFSELERQDVICRENVRLCKEKLKKLMKTLDTEETKLTDLKKQPDKFEGEALELVKNKERLEKKKSTEDVKLKEIMASMKEETVGLQEEKEKHETKLIDLKKVVNETKAELDMVQSELDMYLSTERKEQTRLKELEDKHSEAVSSVKDKKRLHEEAKVRIPKSEEKIKKDKNLLQQVTEKERAISEEIKMKRIKLDEAKSVSSTRSRSVIAQALMQHQKAGKIKGVFGRLGDLGAIDEKYDVAISTACGALDNIVTDTMNTAQDCVKFIKENNVGYATFIALDKMVRWEQHARQKISTPENVPRLFDLVRVKDNRVLPAFYFALQNTLVANDLEQATRIGLHGAKRYRVVTLKGELIDLSGTMSGGGGRVSRGRMGQSVANTGNEISQKELDKMTHDLGSLVKTAASLREEKVNLEEEITRSQNELVGLQHALKKNSIESEALMKTRDALMAQIENQKSKVRACAADKNKVNGMQVQIDKARKAYDKAVGAASGVEATVKRLHGEIMAITKGKFGVAQKSVDKLKKDIDSVQANITKCKVAAKTATRNMKKTEDKIQSVQDEIEQAKLVRDKLLQEFKALEEKGNKVVGNRDLAVVEMKTQENAKKAVAEEIHAIKEKELKLKSESIELKNKLKNEEGIVKEKSDAVRHFKSKIAKLKLHEIDEEDDDDETPKVLPTLTDEEIEELDTSAISYELGSLQTQMSKMKPNMAAIAEYRRKAEVYKQKLAELEEVTKKRDLMKKHHDDLRKQRAEEFMNGFKIITAKLKEVYQMITLGGDAELELVDTLDPFAEGIVFSVRPPKKSWKAITNLSGGEKTLSSLALVFALHYYKPTPFYVMDEIDAALDFKNVSIVGNYIKERTKNAQFMIISLRNNMFELSDRLIGIFKKDNCTRSVSVSPYELSSHFLFEADIAKTERQDTDNLNSCGESEHSNSE